MEGIVLRLRLSLLMFLQFAAPGALLPLYSMRLQELGFSAEIIACCCATQALALVLVALSVGQMADRWFSAERCLAVCAALGGATLWLLAELRDPLPLFACTLAYWMLTGPILFLGVSICFSHLPHPEKEFGYVRLWGTVGWMAPGWLLIGWFSDGRADSADAFRLGGLLAFILAGYALTLPHTPPRRNSVARSAPLAALRQLRGRTAVVFLLCTFGVYIFFPFTSQGTPLLLKQLGVSRAWMMPTVSLSQAVEASTIGFLPLLLPRFGARGVMLPALAAWTFGLLLVGVGRSVVLVVASLPCTGLCVSGYMVVGQMYINRQARPDLRASMQALLAFLTGTAMLLGHLLLGVLRHWMGGELPPAFAVGAGVTAVLLGVFYVGFGEVDTAPATVLPAEAPP
jgi:Nucleoside H+ symporter